MSQPPLLDAPKLSAEDIRRCIDTLEALVQDPALITRFSKEERAALLVAAGRVSRPMPAERSRIKNAARRFAREKVKLEDRATRADTGIRSARRAPIYIPPSREEEGGPERELQKSRDCYVCKAQFRKLHFFYDSMCPDCAELNYAKRFQTASLAGRTALITGARLKIGYQASLMMLKAGARVLATTRFP